MVSIVRAASDPYFFRLLRKDPQISHSSSPRDMHLLAHVLMEYLDTQGIEYPPIPPDALLRTKVDLRFARMKKRDSDLSQTIERVVYSFTTWTYDREGKFEPIPSSCNFDSAMPELRTMLRPKLTEPSPTVAAGVVDVVAPIDSGELDTIPSELFVLMALWPRDGSMPQNLVGLVKPGPDQLAEQQRLYAQAYTGDFIKAIKDGNLRVFLEHLHMCCDAFDPAFLVPGNENHEEMANILLNGCQESAYKPARLEDNHQYAVAEFLLDAARGNSDTIQRIALGKPPLQLIPRPQLKLLVKENLVTVDEFHEICPPDPGPIPGSRRFQQAVRRAISHSNPGAPGPVVMIKYAKDGTRAQEERDRAVRKAGFLPKECVIARPDFVHSACTAYIVERCPYNQTLQVVQIILANGTTVDALKKQGRTTEAGYATSDISWKNHPSFAHLQKATPDAPVMSAAANELHGIATAIADTRKDYSEFM